MDLVLIQSQLEQKRGEATDFYSKIPKKKLASGEEVPDFTTSQFEEFKSRTAELASIGEVFDTLQKDARRKQDAEAKGADKEDAANLQTGTFRSAKMDTPADVLFKSDAWKVDKKDRKRMGEIELDFDFAEYKTTMTTTAGYAPQVLRDGDVVPAIYRPPQLIDFLLQYPTEQNAIKFMKESTRTSGAAETSEGSALSEATLAYTETTDIISKIGHILPITEEELEDDPVVRTLVNIELLNMVNERLDQQVTVGNGAAPNLRGIFNATNIQTQALGANTFIDTVAQAIQKVQITGRGKPNLVVLHGQDYWTLMQKKDSQNRYLMVNPGEMPKPFIWGLPIATSEALTATNGLVLDTTYFPVAIRKGLSVEISNSHSDFFAKNQLCIRAYIRAGIKKRRDEAACKMTGLA